MWCISIDLTSADFCDGLKTTVFPTFRVPVSIYLLVLYRYRDLVDVLNCRRSALSIGLFGIGAASIASNRVGPGGHGLSDFSKTLSLFRLDAESLEWGRWEPNRSCRLVTSGMLPCTCLLTSQH